MNDSIHVASHGLPQHLVYSDSSQRRFDTQHVRSLGWRRRTSSSSGALTAAAVTAVALLAAAPGALALSVPSAPTPLASTNNVLTLVDQARMIRELRNGSDNDGSLRALRRLSVDLDKDALSAALFGDDFNNSLESAIANLSRIENDGVSEQSSKSRAEEFDRFMEEDATVASIVQENIRPGSLVDEVRRSCGPDIADMEALLQREAMDRRRSREGGEALGTGVAEDVVASSSASAIEATRKTNLASEPRSSSSALVSSEQRKKSSSALLTREQEYALARTIQAGTRVHKLKAEYESEQSQPLSKKQWAQLAGMSSNDLRKLISDYRSAKQELVSQNLGLVHAVARSYSRKAKYKGVSLEELVQEGSLGLIRAAELFDPARGLRFSTYATIWIKGILSNAKTLEEVITLPNRERVLWRKVQAAWGEMALESGGSGGGGTKPRADSAAELAARLGLDRSYVEDHLRRMSCVSNVLSLDYQYDAQSRSGYTNDNKQEALMSTSRFGTDADIAEQAQFKADIVAGLVRNLSEREVTLMRLRYGLEDGKECTIKECAEIMGINRETARLLQHACLKKLRQASSMESLQEYLLTVA